MDWKMGFDESFLVAKGQKWCKVEMGLQLSDKGMFAESYLPSP